MALTATRSPSLTPFTAEPSFQTMPTASCPRVRLLRSPMAPRTVWLSEVQIRAAVVLMMAPLGPGSVGIGFSTKPTFPILFMTKAFINRRESLVVSSALICSSVVMASPNSDLPPESRSSIGVQPRQQVRHAKKGEQHDGKSNNRKVGGAAASPAAHHAHMQVAGIDQPGD